MLDTERTSEETIQDAGPTFLFREMWKESTICMVDTKASGGYWEDGNLTLDFFTYDATEDCEYYADLEATIIICFLEAAQWGLPTDKQLLTGPRVYFSDSLKCISFVLMVICFLEAAQWGLPVGRDLLTGPPAGLEIFAINDRYGAEHQRRDTSFSASASFVIFCTVCVRLCGQVLCVCVCVCLCICVCVCVQVLSFQWNSATGM